MNQPEITDSIRYKKRMKGLLLQLAAVLICVCIQLFLIRWTGQGIPCLFRLITGFKCPGCGVSHMLLDLLRGDLAGAFHENAAILLTLPLMVYLFVRGEVRAVVRGEFYFLGYERLMLYAIIMTLVIYSFMRNLTAFF